MPRAETKPQFEVTSVRPTVLVKLAEVVAPEMPKYCDAWHSAGPLGSSEDGQIRNGNCTPRVTEKLPPQPSFAALKFHLL